MGWKTLHGGFLRDDIVVRYGPKSAFDANPTASDGSLYTLDNSGSGGAQAAQANSPDVSLSFRRVLWLLMTANKAWNSQCTTMEGVGKDLWLSVQVGRPYTPAEDCQGGDPALCTIKRSVPFEAGITYGRPIVASYLVDGQKADNLNTAGGEILLVSGANFGPKGTPVQSAEYGDTTTYAAQNCEVLDHRTIQCKTSRGAGTNHKLVVTIGGQKSTVPAVEL